MFFLSQSTHNLIHNHEALLGLRDIVTNQAYNALLTQFLLEDSHQRTIINDLIFNRAFSPNTIRVNYFTNQSRLSINHQQLLDTCRSANQLEKPHILTFNGLILKIHPYNQILENELIEGYWNKDIEIHSEYRNSTNQLLLHNLFYALSDAACIEIAIKEGLIEYLASNRNIGANFGSNNDCSIEIVDQHHLNLYTYRSTLPYQIHATAFFKLISLTIEQGSDNRPRKSTTTIIFGQEATIDIIYK